MDSTRNASTAPAPSNPLRSRLPWLAPLALAVALGGCSSLPAQPVADVKTVAGTWEGELVTSNGPYPYRVTINEDGSTEAKVPALPPGTFRGQYRTENGRIKWVSETTGRTGTCTLHEGDGQRVLKCRADDGATTSEARPVR